LLLMAEKKVEKITKNKMKGMKVAILVQFSDQC
jgi:hypothetical protein